MPTKRESQTIASHLLDYGDECDFRPITARDYGSRARGIESESSDYDVFFVFAQRPADYALGSETETYTKTIDPDDTELDTEIEFHGWNLRRFVGNDGLLGSNPTAIEFCGSDESYYMDDALAPYVEAMIDHAIDRFKPYALMNHYRSLAASNFGKYIEGDYTLTSGTSWDDLLFPADPSWSAIAHESTEGLVVDDGESTIGIDEITVYGRFEQTPYLGTIDIDDAIDRGLVEETTLDRTNKRYLNVCQALLKARLVESTHECPTMDVNDLLRESVEYDWLSEDVYAKIGSLVADKRSSGQTETGSIELLDDWIRSELDREIEPNEHVRRQPNRAQIMGAARDLYNTIEWYGT